jgi:hypothetical protein
MAAARVNYHAFQDVAILQKRHDTYIHASAKHSLRHPGRPLRNGQWFKHCRHKQKKPRKPYWLCAVSY